MKDKQIMKKRTTKKKLINNGRAKGQTQISISLDESIVSDVDKCALENDRSRSNMIRKILKEYLMEKQRKIRSK